MGLVERFNAEVDVKCEHYDKAASLSLVALILGQQSDHLVEFKV